MPRYDTMVAIGRLATTPVLVEPAPTPPWIDLVEEFPSRVQGRNGGEE
jgi:hypothetical protein